MRTEAPASGQCRPPTTTVAGHAGASVRPTVRVRPTVPARVRNDSAGLEPADPYVRRFWVAAIGPSAVAELLRVIRAAGKGEDVRLPRHLPLLLRTGLVRIESGTLTVPGRLPVVPLELRWRFPPALAAEHARWMTERGMRSAPGGEKGHHPESGELADDKPDGDPRLRRP